MCFNIFNKFPLRRRTTNINESILIESLIKYCLVNFQIRGSSRIISSFIFQVLREMNIEAPAVETGQVD